MAPHKIITKIISTSINIMKRVLLQKTKKNKTDRKKYKVRKTAVRTDFNKYFVP